jgi:hypothetical protein
MEETIGRPEVVADIRDMIVTNNVTYENYDNSSIVNELDNNINSVVITILETGQTIKHYTQFRNESVTQLKELLKDKSNCNNLIVTENI